MNKHKFEELKSFDIVKIEESILEKWEHENTFEKSIELRKNAKPFVFYEGPPSANGMPGIHHVISRTIKDMFCRYKTMQGFRVDRKGGWDTHGLPIELNVEKKLNITKKDIGTKISVEDYNKACRTEVLRYKTEWDELTKRIGFWVDLEHPYITFENNYIESVWWSVKQLYEAKKIYKDISIQPYSPAAGTGLSSHELNQPGTYKDVKDTSIVALFEVEKNKQSQFLYDQVHNSIYIMAWTTTPWTLPSNLALAVNQDFEYALIDTLNPYTNQRISVVMAKALVGVYFKDDIKDWKILCTFSGKQLLDIRYKQILPLEANDRKWIEGDCFKVIHSDHVTTENGTGVVHMAPAFGADDYKVCKQHGIGFICLVDKEGKFMEGVGRYAHRYVKNYRNEMDYQDPNIDICVDLKKSGNAFLVQKYEHSYPHCWRTDKPILYYPLDAWFVRITSEIRRLVEVNNTINWKPKSTGEGRFGNWLLNAQDWNLSRSRFWGTPLPIWRTEDGQEEMCIGSISELTSAYQQSVTRGIMQDIFLVKNGMLDVDLHKPFIDQIILCSASGKAMFRETDLMDVWYDSGAMPFAQWHYPFENKEKFEEQFPADFICEGVDQTRGWFYTLHVLGVLLFNKGAFKNVVSNGLVLDKLGNKMSKRLGNVIDPHTTIQKYGADAMRWYMITSSSPWDNMRFDLDGIADIQSKLYSTLYNTYQFFAMYANVDGFTYKEDTIFVQDRTELDQWIISELQSVRKNYEQCMDDYEPLLAHRKILDFVNEHLSNWYVRLSRRRFWKSVYNTDKVMAYQTLYECLESITQIMAPLSPLFADWLFSMLNQTTHRKAYSSIHHTTFDKWQEALINTDLESKMQFAQQICSLALSIRKQQNIKVRQPLQTLLVAVHNADMARHLNDTQEIIKQELNVKNVLHLDSSNEVIVKKVKPNFKLLGKKYGKKMTFIAEALSTMNHEDILQLERNKKIEIQCAGEKHIIFLDEVEIGTKEIQGWSSASNDKCMIALDLNISEELKQEGIARELVNRIQQLRKRENLNITDKIAVTIYRHPIICDIIKKYELYICSEVLATSLKTELFSDSSLTDNIEINNQLIKISIKKI